MNSPLAERARPQSLSQVVGQRHLLAPQKPLYSILQNIKSVVPNLIFYGPSGVGKTTVARLIAEKTSLRLHKLNGTSTSISDIKDVISDSNSIQGYNGILLYLDEIQYLNKKQQQILLEHMENGNITLVASTTENPYFYVYNAILSRSTVFEFKPIPSLEIIPAIQRGFDIMACESACTFTFEDGVFHEIAYGCGGDIRKALNAVELCVLACDLSQDSPTITLQIAKSLTQRSNMRYDRDGDQHYDTLSALQKSIRGSDENAALHYLARLLESGDMLSACRRLLVIACEDVGLAYPTAITITKSCIDAATQLGLPEARIPLAQATIVLATAPKSNTAYNAINAAIQDLQHGEIGPFPRCLQNVHLDGDEIEADKKGQHYLYPHDFPNHYTPQQYLPDSLATKIYYQYGDNKTEQAAKSYWSKIKP